MKGETDRHSHLLDAEPKMGYNGVDSEETTKC